MNFSPLKKVGEPVVFKGLKGPFLTTALIRAGIVVLIFGVILMVSIDLMVKLIISGGVLGIYVLNVRSLREKSKGDLQIALKKNCRKRVIIKK